MAYELEILVVLSVLVAGALRYLIGPSAIGTLAGLVAPLALLGTYLAFGLWAGQWYWEPGLASAGIAVAVVACLMGAGIGVLAATLIKKSR